jgi:hypothetical protein
MTPIHAFFLPLFTETGSDFGKLQVFEGHHGGLYIAIANRVHDLPIAHISERNTDFLAP